MSQQQRRAAWLLGKCCVECGSTEQLDIDHIDPSTKDPRLIPTGAMTHFWSWPEADREAELAKCQVLCRTHHRIKTGRESSLRNRGVPRTVTQIAAVTAANRRRVWTEEMRARASAAHLAQWARWRAAH